MSGITCFLLEPTDAARESLRRYSARRTTDPCPLTGYHNVTAKLGAVPFASEWDGCGADDFPHADPRWPAHCACGYTFRPEDAWQHNLRRIFRRVDTDELMTEDEAPPGAMRLVDRGYLTHSAECLARGTAALLPHLRVKLPDGTWWDVDEPASKDFREGGSGWSRTGVPPVVTASPSILIPGAYHGWLRDGVLVPC